MAKMAFFNEKIPRRAVLGAMMFLACMFSYVIRTNFPITVIAMIKTTRKDSCLGPALFHEGVKSYKSVELKDFGEFEWNEHIQELLLPEYFIGIPGVSILAGLMADRYGGSKVVAFATLIPAILNLLIPWTVSLHHGYVFALRFVMGFFGGAVYPALHAMIARWVPPGERGMFVWTMQGGQFGTLVTFALCDAVINSYGWKAVFYVTSGPMLVFCALWVYLTYDTPDLHPSITEKEKTYIKEQVGTTVSKQKLQLPFKSFATSPPFLVLLWAYFAHMCGIYFIATYGPKYMLEVLGFNMKTGGAITVLPYIVKLGAGVPFAVAGDYILRKNFLSLIRIRRIFMLFSHLGPAACLIVMTSVGCDATTAIIMLILALAFNGAACQTSLQNHQDLAPNYAGSLYGIMNTFGSLSAFIIPTIICTLTKNGNGVEEWRIMFWILVVMFISATVLFWLFGSGEIQSWNNSTYTKMPTVSEEEQQINETAEDEIDTETEEIERR